MIDRPRPTNDPGQTPTLPPTARQVHPHGAQMSLPFSRAARLVRGRLAVYCEHRLVEVAESERWLGLANALRGHDAPALRLDCLSECEVEIYEGRALADALEHADSSLPRALLGELAEQQRVNRDYLISQDDTYLDAASLYPPPYSFGPFRCIQLVVEHDPEHLRRILPWPLCPAPGMKGRSLVLVSDIERSVAEHPRSDRREWTYREVVPFIPAVSPLSLGVGLYTPELYPSAYSPILIGREVYGFPKRLGRIKIGPNSAHLILDQQLALDMAWGSAESITAADAAQRMGHALCPALFNGALGKVVRKAIELAPNAGPDAALLGRLPASAFVRKQIRHYAHPREDRWQHDELVKVPLQFTHLSAPKLLHGCSLRLGSRWPMGAGELLAAIEVQVGFRLGFGRRLWRYT